ncbi:hypothetical protein HPB48_008558 [Haemaphysalis longicornis]|uniref:Uncharacterized protein n=1 Tax=Haemaphysalis longicornis TaxID=44386 RepID=A0A9J6G5L9_HAELO|nr:hypothetical protein HPB48_008558 [Haemaphysalis longicornis]
MTGLAERLAGRSRSLLYASEPTPSFHQEYTDAAKAAQYIEEDIDASDSEDTPSSQASKWAPPSTAKGPALNWGLDFGFGLGKRRWAASPAEEALRSAAATIAAVPPDKKGPVRELQRHVLTQQQPARPEPCGGADAAAGLTRGTDGVRALATSPSLSLCLHSLIVHSLFPLPPAHLELAWG